MIALSCIVVVCTVYALSLPAQTLACDKEEHTHTAECYDENNELICEKEEHTHTDDCNKQEEVNEANEVNEQEESSDVKDESETQNKDEQESQVSEEETTTTTETTMQPFDLNSHSESIKSIKFTYKQNKVDKTIESGGTVLNADNTDIAITVNCNSISVKTLKSCGGQITYQLPDVFRIIDTTVSNIIETNSSNKIGTIQANSDGKVFVAYNMDYLNNLHESSTIDDANFFVSTQIKLERLTSVGMATVNTPIGDIYLNYGADYYEHYGKLSVVKNKEDKRSEYIKYTIKLTAGVDGLKNVYVVDKFTENWDVVDYVGIEQNPVELKGKENEKDPFETITDGLTHGKIYLTNKSDDKIPNIVTGNLSDHKSFVWSVETMKPNEERILTYYVKLKDKGGKININNNQIIKNQSNVYSKNNQTIYDKGSSEAEFNPYIDYSMNKEKLEQSQDKNGVYTIKYKLSFKLNESSNYPLKDFVFWDYLNNTSGDITSTHNVYYDESSIQLFDGSGKEISKDKYQVLWANRSDTQYSKIYSNDITRLQVRGSSDKPINMNPGDSYYLTYNVKVKPEAYAVMKSDSVDINNVYYASSSNACNGESSGIINKITRKITLSDYNWVNKTLNQNKVETDTTITIDGD